MGENSINFKQFKVVKPSHHLASRKKFLDDACTEKDIEIVSEQEADEHVARAYLTSSNIADAEVHPQPSTSTAGNDSLPNKQLLPLSLEDSINLEQSVETIYVGKASHHLTSHANSLDVTCSYKAIEVVSEQEPDDVSYNYLTSNIADTEVHPQAFTSTANNDCLTM